MAIVILSPLAVAYALDYLFTSLIFFFIYLMLFTSVLIIALPIIVPFNRWNPPEGNNNIIPIIQTDATVIVGTFFLLNVVAPENLKPLLTPLTALSVIPFLFSAILVAVWGNHPFWEGEKGEKIQGYTNPVTGVKLGITFMIAGFVWLIVVMIMLSVTDPQNIAITLLGNEVVNATIPDG